MIIQRPQANGYQRIKMNHPWTNETHMVEDDADGFLVTWMLFATWSSRSDDCVAEFLWGDVK